MDTVVGDGGGISVATVVVPPFRLMANALAWKVGACFVAIWTGRGVWIAIWHTAFAAFAASWITLITPQHPEPLAVAGFDGHA